MSLGARSERDYKIKVIQRAEELHKLLVARADINSHFFHRAKGASDQLDRDMEGGGPNTISGNLQRWTSDTQKNAYIAEFHLCASGRTREFSPKPFPSVSRTELSPILT